MENKYLSPAKYPNVVPTYLGGPGKTVGPFIHNELKKSLEVIISNSKPKQKSCPLEDMFSDKAVKARQGGNMGSLFLRGKTWWIKYYRNGKCFRENSESTLKMVAKKMLARKEGEIASGLTPSILFDKVTFDELAKDYSLDYTINRKKSLDRAKFSLKHLEKEFTGSKIPEITTPRIQGYVSDRMKWQCREYNSEFHIGGELKCPECGSGNIRKGAANATINREFSALRRILNLGARQTPPKVSRVPYIPMLKENNTRKGFFEHNHFIALRDALPDYLNPFVPFGYKVGWRDKEITKLTWNNVTFKMGLSR